MDARCRVVSGIAWNSHPLRSRAVRAQSLPAVGAQKVEYIARELLAGRGMTSTGIQD